MNYQVHVNSITFGIVFDTPAPALPEMISALRQQFTSEQLDFSNYDAMIWPLVLVTLPEERPGDTEIELTERIDLAIKSIRV